MAAGSALGFQARERAGQGGALASEHLSAQEDPLELRALRLREAGLGAGRADDLRRVRVRGRVRVRVRVRVSG